MARQEHLEAAKHHLEAARKHLDIVGKYREGDKDGAERDAIEAWVTSTIADGKSTETDGASVTAAGENLV